MFLSSPGSERNLEGLVAAGPLRSFSESLGVRSIVVGLGVLISRDGFVVLSSSHNGHDTGAQALCVSQESTGIAKSQHMSTMSL